MDAPDMRTWIDACISAAEAEMAGDLPADVLAIPGMTSAHVRSFLHHLTKHPNITRYAEVGAHMGATACAAGCNDSVDVSVCDNFSQFQLVDFAVRGTRRAENSTARVEDICKANLRKHLGDRFWLFEGDSAEWDIGPQDVLLYDGDHSEAATYKNIRRLVSEADPRVLIVDDFDGDDVAAGTIRALCQLSFDDDDTVAAVWRRPWWNGVLVVLFERREREGRGTEPGRHAERDRLPKSTGGGSCR